MRITRRRLLAGLTASASAVAFPSGASAKYGAINANSLGLRAGSAENQGKIFQSILDRASFERKPVFVEPGNYRISDIALPNFAHIEGISGATKIVFGGGNHFFHSEKADQLSLSGLDFEGGFLPTADYSNAALSLNRIKSLSISECRISQASGTGLHVIGSAGIIRHTHISDVVGPAGFMGHNNSGILFTSNTVENCANGGILIHRWTRGEDNTIVTQNRVRRISAIYGGTGQWGNGINTYQADGVIVTDNHISDCAFSTIRSNSCSNIQISDNTCLRAGETSVYSEFAFEGAKITGNIVEGGATGISMANFIEGGRMGVCSNNIVRNMHAELPYEPDGHIHGNGIYAEADTVISGNVVEDTKNFGLMLGWGPYLRNVLADANIIRKCRSGIYVSVVDGIRNVSIADSIMSELSGHAIVGHHWHEAVTGDLAGLDSKEFADLEIEGNRVDS